MAARCCVIKIGGSLCSDDALADWLQRLVDTARGAAVIVPGGGPFADQVREAQRRWNFADDTAHWMAIRAMEQFALMLCGLQRELVAVDSITAIEAALANQALPVWLPTVMLQSAPDIAQNWTMSSDSLALWLAQQLQAEELALVKYHSLDDATLSVSQLQQLNILDAGFAEQLQQSAPLTWRIYGRSDSQLFRV